MIQVCRECDVKAGGLIPGPGDPPAEVWPEVDLCPRCAVKVAKRCPCSFPHPPHDECDGNPNAPPLAAPGRPTQLGRNDKVRAALLGALLGVKHIVDQFEHTTHGMIPISHPITLVASHLTNCWFEPTAYNLSNLSQAIDSLARHKAAQNSEPRKPDVTIHAALAEAIPILMRRLGLTWEAIQGLTPRQIEILVAGLPLPAAAEPAMLTPWPEKWPRPSPLPRSPGVSDDTQLERERCAAILGETLADLLTDCHLVTPRDIRRLFETALEEIKKPGTIGGNDVR